MFVCELGVLQSCEHWGWLVVAAHWSWLSCWGTPPTCSVPHRGQAQGVTELTWKGYPASLCR